MSDFGMQLDVTSSDGSILKSMDSELIHEQGLLHRAVHLLLVNSEQQIYVRKRSETLELYPGVWTSSVGEHVFHGETVEQTAKRALDEFLGLSISCSKLGLVHVQDNIENELMSVYTAQSDNVPYLNPEHSEEGHFLSIEQLVSIVNAGESTPHLRAAIKLYNQQ